MVSERVPLSILNNLISDDQYARKTIPFIDPEYFEERTDKIVFNEIVKFIKEYDELPTKEVLQIEVGKRTDLTQDEFQNTEQLINSLGDAEYESKWALDTTEAWCKERAIYNALMESIKIADGQDEKKNRDAIPSILTDALAVGFDKHDGHD